MDDDDDDKYCTDKPWNGYLSGFGFIFLIAGAVLLGIGCETPSTVKIDPSCEDNKQHIPCARKVLKSSADEKVALKITGAICFTVGFIIMTIDCFTCWKCYRWCPYYDGDIAEISRRNRRRSRDLVSLDGYGGNSNSNDRASFLATTTIPDPSVPTIITSIPTAPTLLDSSNGPSHQPVCRAPSDSQQWTGKRELRL